MLKGHPVLKGFFVPQYIHPSRENTGSKLTPNLVHRFAFEIKDFRKMGPCEVGSEFLHHVHGHLRRGAILTSVTRAAALLAAGGVADHVHGVHASIGQVLALSECPCWSRGAEQPPLGLLRAGSQARGSGEVVSVQIVRVVEGESIVGSLLHVVVASTKHMGRGRGGSG